MGATVCRNGSPQLVPRYLVLKAPLCTTECTRNIHVQNADLSVEQSVALYRSIILLTHASYRYICNLVTDRLKTN